MENTMQSFNVNGIKRFFAFGCSFTRYGWMTWPMIVAIEAKVPYWNYATAGAGNQYIFNTIIQADAFFKFNSDDLVIVCWTNVCREDRYVEDNWICPGNIYTQNIYNDDWVEKFADPAGMALRDYATISATDDFLKNKGCQYHFLSMIDITKVFNQYNYGLIDTFLNKDKKTMIDKLKETFNDSLSKIRPSFYDVLWDGKIDTKTQSLWKQFESKFSDSHPSPNEHYQYIKTVLEYEFHNNTITKVQDAHNTWEKILYEWAADPNRSVYPHQLLYQKTNIAEEYERRPEGWFWSD